MRKREDLLKREESGRLSVQAISEIIATETNETSQRKGVKIPEVILLSGIRTFDEDI